MGQKFIPAHEKKLYDRLHATSKDNKAAVKDCGFFVP